MEFLSDPEAAGFDAAGLEKALRLLDDGMPQLHDGYQLYVSRWGRPVLDAAGGEARPGKAMTTESIPLWFSSSKPATAIAIAQLWERGQLDLDDLVSKYIPDWGNGKEACTIRHLLTHRGGFPLADLAQVPESWEELSSRVAAAPALVPPGAAAAYHATAGWVVLGELVARIDGRRVDQYVREEIFEPLGMRSSWLGIPPEELEAVRDRVAFIEAKLPESDPTYFMFNLPGWNSDKGLTMVTPGGGGRGPAHDLGRFYEMVLARGTLDGTRIVSPQALEAFTAIHRFGLEDLVLSMDAALVRRGSMFPWCLGFVPQSPEFGDHASFRSVGHSGHASSTAFCDPENGLVVALITNGLPGFERSGDRINAVTTAIGVAAGLDTREPESVTQLRATVTALANSRPSLGS